MSQRRFLAFVLGLALVPALRATTLASVECFTMTIAEFATLPEPGGCFLDTDPSGLNDFSVTNLFLEVPDLIDGQTPNSAVLGPSDFIVSFSHDATGIEVRFSFVEGILSQEGEFHRYLLGYLIDPPPDIILGQGLEFDDFGSQGFVTQGFVTQQIGGISIAADLCVAGFFDGTFCGGRAQAGLVVTSEDEQPSGFVRFPFSTNLVDVRLTVDVFGDAGLREFASTSVTSVVPEPATLALFSVGLGLLALVRRRRGR